MEERGTNVLVKQGDRNVWAAVKVTEAHGVILELDTRAQLRPGEALTDDIEVSACADEMATVLGRAGFNVCPNAPSVWWGMYPDGAMPGNGFLCFECNQAATVTRRVVPGGSAMVHLCPVCAESLKAGVDLRMAPTGVEAFRERIYESKTEQAVTAQVQIAARAHGFDRVDRFTAETCDQDLAGAAKASPELAEIFRIARTHWGLLTMSGEPGRERGREV